MRYQTGLRKERLARSFLLFVLCLCLCAAAQAREYIRTIVNDPWGNPIMVLDDDGAVIARYTYAPFGSQVPAQATARQRLGFVGGIRETPGLHYLKHRYYNPQLGRFYQPDPVDFLQRGVPQINRYAYGRNDPYTYQDKDGRCGPACVALIPLAIWAIDNLHSDTPSPNPIPPSGVGDTAVMGYAIGQVAVTATTIRLLNGASAIELASASRIAADAGHISAGTRGYRYITEAELQAIKETGLLRGGRPGETFFTKDIYKSAAQAQERLSLPIKPTYRIEFEIINNPVIISNGTKIAPVGQLSGGGAEFMTTDLVRVNLINAQPLR